MTKSKGFSISEKSFERLKRNGEIKGGFEIKISNPEKFRESSRLEKDAFDSKRTRSKLKEESNLERSPNEKVTIKFDHKTVLP